MSRKIKVSFEVTDNWTKDDFRLFIRELLKNTDKYEVYIISNDDSSAYILGIGQILEMDPTKVLVVSFTQDKINAISGYEIDIHLDNLLYVVTQVDELTDAHGILVNEMPDKYLVKPKYMEEFGRLEEQILSEES